jgi:hypothetical protein
MRDYDRAIADFSQAILLTPTDESAYRLQCFRDLSVDETARPGLAEGFGEAQRLCDDEQNGADRDGRLGQTQRHPVEADHGVAAENVPLWKPSLTSGMRSPRVLRRQPCWLDRTISDAVAGDC